MAEFEAERPLIREKRLPPKGIANEKFPISKNDTKSKKLLLLGLKNLRKGSPAFRKIWKNTNRVEGRKKRWIRGSKDSAMFNDELWEQEWYLASQI